MKNSMNYQSFMGWKELSTAIQGLVWLSYACILTMSHLTSSCLHLIANIEVLLVAFKQTAGIPLCGMERNSSLLLKRRENFDSY